MPASRPPAARSEGHRQPVRADVPELLAALLRLRIEAELLAEQALLGIELHSYTPYRNFRAKVGEHAALIAVIRARAQQMMALEGGEARLAKQEAEGAELDMLVLAVKAALRYGFALSANPMLPLGARETFLDEMGMLAQARTVLEAAPREAVPEGILEDLDTARMILGEIIEKSPPLADFGSAA